MTCSKEFYGMEYPFAKCERPNLYRVNRCLDCSVRRFCKAPELYVAGHKGKEVVK